ncbi:ABC-type transport auxiliary lipoprotein family protein [Halomonas icarae]|uniref:ABC-type transport auxiliary lipoprotein component domain-containing protein n=1 Tax=Halomonas icarae TaxID=2691040 RepID=A0A7X4VW58_9GAMM|nr:ABC-type transport auxiliary lipoprotein family protein [Halomonas icarae]MDR5901016.1 ABC-type transport auxiliary lipoprotein family protein [Halomonas icarae]NAW11291.1 hypothetical protein [Halomonas icarae]
MTPRHPIAALLALLLLFTAGCTILPDREPQRLFALPASPDLDISGPSVAATLRVDSFSASAPHGGNRLLVMPSPDEYEAWSGVRWRDDASRLLQERLLEGFRQTGRLKGVVDDASRARSDATLTGHLTAFYLRLDRGTRHAVVRLDAQLIDESRRELLTSRRFEATSAAGDATPEAAIKAFGQASDALAEALIGWVVEAL